MLKAWAFSIPKRDKKGEKKSKIVEFKGCLWRIVKTQRSCYDKGNLLYQYV